MRVKHWYLFVVAFGVGTVTVGQKVATTIPKEQINTAVEKPSTIIKQAVVVEPKISLITKEVKDITTISAWCVYEVNSQGVQCTSQGICVGKGLNPSTDNQKFFSKGVTGPTYGALITGLSPGTQYHVRAFAITPNGTVYGNDLVFKTLFPSK